MIDTNKSVYEYGEESLLNILEAKFSLTKVLEQTIVRYRKIN